MSGSWDRAVADVKSIRATRKAFGGFLTFLNATDSELSAGEIVFGELVANALIHGEPGSVQVSASQETEGVRLSVRSVGRRFAFDPRACSSLQTSGRGFQIVAALACEVSVEHLEGINTIVALLPLGATNDCELTSRILTPA